VHGINADQVSSMTVEMRDLSAIARNPIEAYFRKTLGIYLNRRQGSLYKDEEDFVLSPLERAIIKKASLGIPIDKVLQDAEREGRLPIGGFKPLVIEQIRRDVAELRKNLDVLGVNYEDMYAIELSPRCHEPKEIGRRQWEVPALDMVMDNGQSLSIVGMLDNITPSGMLSWLKDDRVDVLKAWPQFLVLEKILKKYSLPFGNQLIFAKSGKAKPSFVSDPQESLRNYLAYYLQGIRHVSPLIPEWVPPILNEDAKALEKRILQTVSSQEIFSNEHVRWILGGGKLPDPEVLIKHWKSVGNSLFSDLYQQWYPPRGGKK